MRQWSWIGACSVGSSHIRAGTTCQDSAGCLELADEHALLAIVSDGAGSAEHSAIGSRLVVECFARCVIAHLRANQPLESITKELALDWLDNVLDHIFRSAAHGEYASSTYFVTDDREPNLQFHLLEGEFNEVAIFSDGIERLALDFANGNAFVPFFEPMFAPLVALGPGRDRQLSLSLRKYLDSPRVIE